MSCRFDLFWNIFHGFTVFVQNTYKIATQTINCLRVEKCSIEHGRNAWFFFFNNVIFHVEIHLVSILDFFLMIRLVSSHKNDKFFFCEFIYCLCKFILFSYGRFSYTQSSATRADHRWICIVREIVCAEIIYSFVKENKLFSAALCVSHISARLSHTRQS